MGHREHGQSKVGLVIGVLVVAAIGGGAWYFMAGGSPEKAVSQFIAAQAAGDAEAAKAVLAKNSQGMAANLGKMAMAGKKDDMPTIGDATVEGDRAKVPVTHKVPEAMAKMTGMTEMTMTFVAVKEDGAWKVDLPASAEEMLKGLANSAGGAMKGAVKGAVAGAKAAK